MPQDSLIFPFFPPTEINYSLDPASSIQDPTLRTFARCLNGLTCIRSILASVLAGCFRHVRARSCAYVCVRAMRFNAFLCCASVCCGRVRANRPSSMTPVSLPFSLPPSLRVQLLKIFLLSGSTVNGNAAIDVGGSHSGERQLGARPLLI